LPSYPGPETSWYFNPFAWQFLFFLGAFFGWGGPTSTRWRANRLFIGVVIAIAAGSFIVHLSWVIHWLYDPFPTILYATLIPFWGKTELTWLRLINILALAILVIRFVGPRDAWLQHPLAYPFILCGRHSLHVFCLGILLAIVSRLVLNEFYGGILAQAGVTLAGVAIMIAVAWLMDWVRTNVTVTRAGERIAAGGGE
jgi:hypothetical protein